MIDTLIKSTVNKWPQAHKDPQFYEAKASLRAAMRRAKVKAVLCEITEYRGKPLITVVT